MTDIGGARPDRDPVPAAAPEGRSALGEALASSAFFLRWTLAALAAAYLLSGIFVVGPEEEAVVLTFGRLDEGRGEKRARGPGIYFALPAPFQEIVKLPTRRVREMTINAFSRSASAYPPNEAGSGAGGGEEMAAGEDRKERGKRPAEKKAEGKRGDPEIASEPPNLSDINGLDPVAEGYLISADMNLVRASMVVRWRIADLPRHMFEHARTADALRAAVESAAIAVVGGTPIDELLGEGREKARGKILELAQRAADGFGLGVEIVSLDIPLLEPPAFLADAFREVNAARIEAKGLADEARAYREQNIEAAAAEANRMIRSAEGYRAERIARARGETSRFLALLARYRTDPEVFGKRMYAEAVEQILESVGRKIVLPPGDGRAAVRLLLDEHQWGTPEGGTAGRSEAAGAGSGTKGIGGTGVPGGAGR
ncbi:MAG: protease modulator HflK [Planctomycetota bacterium]|nr:protease modulator HflK [Planctomycetota bacterium]